MEKMKIACLQTKPVLGEVEENRGKAAEKTKKAAQNGAKLIVLPELAFSGYRFKNKKEAQSCGEKIPFGESPLLLQNICEKHECFVVAGVLEKKQKKLYNSSVLVGPSGVLSHYRKLHLYSEEKKIFEPGNLAPPVFDTGVAKIGMMICFDWYYPEVPRTLALKGAEIIAHPTNLVIRKNPAYQGDVFHAKWNRVYFALADRVGKERGLEFLGNSRIISPQGEVLAKAGSKKQETIYAEIDPKKARDKKINKHNDLFKDRTEKHYKA